MAECRVPGCDHDPENMMCSRTNAPARPVGCHPPVDGWDGRSTHCGECGFPKVVCQGEHGPLQGKLGGQMPSQVGWGSETDIGYPPLEELVSLEPNTAYLMEARGGLTAQDFVLTPYDEHGNLLHDKAIKVGSFPERDLAQAPYPMVVREVAPGDWQAGIDYVGVRGRQNGKATAVRRLSAAWGALGEDRPAHIMYRGSMAHGVQLNRAISWNDDAETDRTFENETRPL